MWAEMTRGKYLWPAAFTTYGSFGQCLPSQVFSAKQGKPMTQTYAKY